ncbi:MAG TPA: PA0069 family radical SAM protein [Bacteroidia bacterium]|jgi:DNA repair photolyase|nr:PA0069 family radical SAM protein [Bacteroidia bacterium]
MSNEENYFKGRGAQQNPQNRFNKQSYAQEHFEQIDEPLLQEEKTEIIFTHPKTILNKVESPDLAGLSMNPYQGCEHGCIYCYARNTHEYWGYSAGLDFERKIIVKENAPELLHRELSKKNHVAEPIMFSGNTDCYQPVERKFEITRRMLEVLLKFRHPVGMITKNALIRRDIDILSQMAKLKLVNVMISITGVDESFRLKTEPRTTTYKQRFETVRQLSEAGIPVGVMVAPIIPGLNSHEIPDVLEEAAKNGARTASYSIVRLNGAVGELFKDWLQKNYPDRFQKVIHGIENCHGGKVNDSRFGKRMSGEGAIAESISTLFKLHKQKFFPNREKFEFDLSLYDHRLGDAQMRLF